MYTSGLISCIDVSTVCDQLSSIAGGYVEYSSGVDAGSVATYRCYPGHTVSVNNTRTCGMDGEWSGAEAQCTSMDTTGHAAEKTHLFEHTVACLTNLSLLTAVVDCMDPPALASGSVDTSRGTTYQSVAVYQCDEGYTLQGQAITACLENGTWSGPTPTCAREWTTQLGLEPALGTRRIATHEYSSVFIIESLRMLLLLIYFSSSHTHKTHMHSY